jgi:hypothetical protein
MMSAQDIYQAHLDAVSEALWEHDFERVLDHISFPSFLETDDALLRINNREAYLPSLKTFRKTLQRLGATAYHRLCREAAFAPEDPNRIEGIHETYALAGTRPVLPPYLNQMTLVHKAGRWLGAGLRSATQNAQSMIITHPEPDAGLTAAAAAKQEHRK